MANTEELLELIISEFQIRTGTDRRIVDLISKIQRGKGTHIDAQTIAIRSGEILSSLFERYLPEALVDGRLYEEVADALIRAPMLENYQLVSKWTRLVQESLNRQAGMGIAARVPPPNMDQIKGIIHGISSALHFDHYKDDFLNQVANASEGIVDSFVRENAALADELGLEPRIVRSCDGPKPCEWCRRLAGTYSYLDVSDNGNDVFRRHKNCHCHVYYVPADGAGRRQDVHTRTWS